MNPFLLLMYVLTVFLFPLAGQHKKIGYGGSLLLCMFLTPLIGVIITVCLPDEDIKPQVIAYKCPHCELTTTVPSHYCPRCLKDQEGYTVEQNTERFKKA